MRVVQATRVQTTKLARVRTEGRAARIERLALAATTVTLLLGVWLTYAGQTSERPTCVPAGATGSPQCINLATVRSARELLPALAVIGDPVERNVVASALFERLRSSGGIEHVGALAAASVPAAHVRANARLAQLNARLKARNDAESVSALSGADLAAAKPSMIVRTVDNYRRRIAWAVALFMAAFWLTHAVRWHRGHTGDPILLPAVHLLTGIGLMGMIALRDPLRDMMIVEPMAVGIAGGCALWIAFGFIDFESPRLRRMVLPPLAAAVALAVALVAFGSGPAGSGARVNLLGVQPVEAIRLLVAFSLAAYFARRWAFLREFSEPIGPRPIRRRIRLPRWKDARPLAITIGTLLLFFVLQRDLGPALVLSCVFLGLYGVSRGRAAMVGGGFAALTAGFAAGYWLGIPQTVTRRVAIWLEPWNNALPGGDQVSHALWALSSGGAWGIGPGVGDPQFIPAGHTDLVVAAIGEELGFTGVACVMLVFVLVIWRLLRIARRAPGDYTFFLATALTLGLAVQAIVITGGMLGLLPLAGVVTPFLSYGRSAMLSNFAALAVCAAIARRAGASREAFETPMRALGWSLALIALMLIGRAGLVQVVRADGIAARANLTQQADGGYRFHYNPRLVAAGRTLTRGTIFDRNGIPLATNDPSEVAAAAGQLRALGLTPACLDAASRCYPLGGLGFHLVGDSDRQLNWAARNTSFVEQDFDAHLKGYDDHAQTVTLTHPRSNQTLTAVRRDYSALLPLIRHKGNPDHDSVRRIAERDRDLHLTVDAGLQVALARAVRDRAIAAGSGRGAAVVVEPATGALLASVSYPWPEPLEISGEATQVPQHLLDRARYGLYPPGSTFKLVTAVAALRSQPSEQRSTFDCVRLPDGRVGGRVPGQPRPVRDDPLDTAPHGHVDMHQALVVSCNAYFASLAQRLGSKALAEAASAAQISIAAAPSESRLASTLAHAGYGQGDVVATPLRMARVSAALASDGTLREVHVAGERRANTDVPWVPAAGADRLRRDMRAVVTNGTGRVLARHPVAIAGKTGTAEVDGAKSHSWFVGFAPYGEESTSARIAFAVVIEHAGYGGRVAAPLAGDLVTAARARGLLK